MMKTLFKNFPELRPVEKRLISFANHNFPKIAMDINTIHID